MKKYLLGLFAVVLAVGFSAFSVKEAPETSKKATFRFLQFKLNIQGPEEKVLDNYTLLTSTSTPAACPGAVKVCWIRVVDQNDDGVISPAEFNAIVNALDTDLDGQISDDQADNTTTYQEKS